MGAHRSNLETSAPVAVAAAAVASLIALVMASAACGPSYQSIYEGDAHFEHCYALDDASDIPLNQKRDCWNRWVTSSTAGQSRDRIEYANARAAALTRAQISPTDDSLMQAAPGGGTTNQVLAPESTNAFAPPPKTLEAMDGGAAAAIASGVQPTSDGLRVAVVDAGESPPAPGASCTTDCNTTWQTCRTGCTGTKCTKCAATYKTCMRGCFK